MTDCQSSFSFSVSSEEAKRQGDHQEAWWRLTLDEPVDQHVQVVLPRHSLDLLKHFLQSVQRLFVRVRPPLLLQLRHWDK